MTRLRRTTHRPRTRLFRRPLLAAALLAVAACSAGPGGEPAQGGEAAGRPLFPDLAAHSWLPGTPEAGASTAFWDQWGDGRAEMSGYRIVTPRYGETRVGELALIYVTEPHDRRRWIKDDEVAGPHRVEVMKLNASLKFQTGVYPYSILTSVFAPVADWGRPRFTPVKLTLSAQEWCGSYRREVWPGGEGFRSLLLSYFTGEGERVREVPAPEDLVWEDALLIQLRELDGPFAGGGDWQGRIVPALWRLRAGHVPAAPVPATIDRRNEVRDGTPVTRFVLEYGDYTRTFDVEKAPPRRILGWTTSDGEEAELLSTDRMAYWRLNGVGDEGARRRMGLDPAARIPPGPPAGPGRPPQ
jgi:hypothetical protein